MYVIAYLVDKERIKWLLITRKNTRNFNRKNKPDMNWILRTQDTITKWSIEKVNSTL